MSPRHRRLLYDRILADARAAVNVAFPEHADDTLDGVTVTFTGGGMIDVAYRGRVVRSLRMGEIEVDDEPLDAPARLTQAGSLR